MNTPEAIIAALNPRTTAYRERLESWLSSHERRFTAEVKDDTLEIAVMDVIGESFFFEGITAKKVKAALDANPGAKLVKVLIDSPGGFTHDGLSIQALLKRYGARVETEVLGEASSAASVVMLAGDRVFIHEGATVMIHPASNCMCGTAKDFRSTADALDTITAGIVDIYTTRTGRSRNEIEKMVEAETWLSSGKAVELGFADEVIPARKKGEKVDYSGQPKKKPKNESAPPISPNGGVMSAPPMLALPGMPAGAVNISPGAPGNEPTDPPAQPSGQTEQIMTISKNIIQALALAEDADEAAVVAAINKIKASARMGASIEALLGVSGDAAVGAVRALKEKNEANEKLFDEVEKLKVVNARRDFETLREQGLKDKKLSPAQAKFYAEKFAKAVKEDENGIPAGDGADVVADLRGFLAVSHRQGSTAVIVQQPNPDGSPAASNGAATHNGKAFENMTPADRLKLKKENLELYNTLREDAQSRGAL